METNEPLRQLVSQFVTRVSELAPPVETVLPSRGLRDTSRKPMLPWEASFGIHAFVNDDGVAYVGRAARDTLGQRVRDHVKDRGDLDWNAIVDDPRTMVVLFEFREHDWFWVPSLEVFLIQELKPKANRRRC